MRRHACAEEASDAVEALSLEDKTKDGLRRVSYPHAVSLHTLVRGGRLVSGLGMVLVGLVLLLSYAGEHGAVELFGGGERHLSGDSSAADEGSGGSSGGSSVSAHDPCSGEGGGHHGPVEVPGGAPPLEQTLAAMFVAYLICFILDHSVLLLNYYVQVPISAVLFLAGMLIYSPIHWYLLRNAEHDDQHRWPHGGNSFIHVRFDGMGRLANMDPHAIFYVLLPPLLYESASSMNWHVLKIVLTNALLLAFPGVIINVLLTACFTKVMIVDALGTPLTWHAALMFSSILSATDPVAVVAALRTLGAPPKLSSLIEGESLFNDGSAFVLFLIFVQDAAGDRATASDKRWPNDFVPRVFWEFAKAGGGALIGYLVGLILMVWMKNVRFRNSPQLETVIALVAVYGTFFLAEMLQCSPVLAVVVLGIVVAAKVNAVMSHDGRHAHHATLEVIGYLCDKLIFLVAGLITLRLVSLNENVYWLECRKEETKGYYTGFLLPSLIRTVGLYAVIHFTRFLVVFGMLPIMQKIGYGVTWKEAVVCVWGGLRGAVGLAMAILVEHSALKEEEKITIAFHTAMVVLSTMVINGSTTPWVYNKLDIYPKNKIREKHVRKVLSKLEDDCRSSGIHKLRKHWFFRDLDAKNYMRCVPNFHEGNVSFDNAGLPTAVNIWSVNLTMAALEQKANKYKWDHEQELNKAGIATYVDRLDIRNKDISEKVGKWNSSSFSSSAEGDQMINVASSGDRDVRFQPCQKFSAGLFAAKTSLAGIFEEVGESKLSYKVEKFPTNIVIIGFINTDTQLIDCEHTVSKAPILGCSADTLGIDSNTGEINNRMGGRAETLAHSGPASGQTNIDVTITFVIAGTTATLSVLIDNAPSKTVTISPFNAETCFPAIEFRIEEEARTSALRGLAAATDDVQHLQSNTSITKLPGAISDEVTQAPSRPSVRSGGSDNSKDKDTRGLRNLEKMRAVVTLPFNLLYNCHEIFVVCINSIVRQYKSMHDHGELGHEALGWLMESAGEALDSVNGELSAMKISDFTFIGGSEKAPSFGEKLARTFKGVSHAAKAEAVTTFEPFIVEYLWLVSECQKPAWTDSVPAKLPFATGIRQMGYAHSRTRVEALWAYVECHERVLHKLDAHVLKRFPQLRQLLMGIIQEVKERDLPFVRDMKPGHYLYSQHYLALRTVISTRLGKVKKHSDEGWLAKKDTDPLLDDLHERLMKVESYFPKIHLKAVNIEESELLPSQDDFCAWDNETFA